jgi:hypothetical protein
MIEVHRKAMAKRKAAWGRMNAATINEIMEIPKDLTRSIAMGTKAPLTPECNALHRQVHQHTDGEYTPSVC